MASITISSPSGAQTNPTNLRLPFNRAGVFADSLLTQLTPESISVINPDTTDNGLLIDNTNGLYSFGDYQAYTNASSININNEGDLFMNQSNLIIYLSNTDGLIKIFNDNITSTTAGILSKYLKLSVNGTKYKIALLNDTL